MVAMTVLKPEALEMSWGMFMVIVATALNPLHLSNVFDIWELQGRHALYQCVEKTIYFGLIWGVVFWTSAYRPAPSTCPVPLAAGCSSNRISD